MSCFQVTPTESSAASLESLHLQGEAPMSLPLHGAPPAPDDTQTVSRTTEVSNVCSTAEDLSVCSIFSISMLQRSICSSIPKCVGIVQCAAKICRISSIPEGRACFLVVPISVRLKNVHARVLHVLAL